MLCLDTTMERNTLMAQCYPKLKDFCREKHGLEFQVTVSIYLTLNVIHTVWNQIQKKMCCVIILIF